MCNFCKATLFATVFQLKLMIINIPTLGLPWVPRKKTKQRNYENLPVQYIEIFFSKAKLKNFTGFFFFYIYNYFAQNIDCG